MIDFNDAWQEIHNFDYDDIPWGLYKIETHDKILFKGHDIYSHTILRKARKHDIEFEVKYQLIPSHRVKNDTFRKIIDMIVECTKDIFKDDKPYYKFLINMLSGLLGKSSVTMTKANINSDIEQILYQFGKIHNDVDEIFVKQIEDTEYFIYGGNKFVKLAENNVPMYIQVLDASNIQMFDLLNSVGGTLIGRKVDCVVVNNPNEIFDDKHIKYGNEWGQFKEADHIPNMLSVEKNNFGKHYTMTVKWKDHRINDSSEYMRIKDIPPVEPEEINTLDNYFDHPAVLNLVNGNMTTLTKTYRYSPELKSILDDINDGKIFDTTPFIIQGYPDTKYNLCFFNATRKAVNKYWNEKERPADFIFIPEDPEDDYTQDMYIYENLPVIARKTIGKGEVCVNNETFNVTCFDEDQVHLYTIRGDEPHYIEIERSKFSHTFALNYCCTIHKSQGETIKDKMTIYDWDSPKLSRFSTIYVRRLRYTGLSRFELKQLEDGSYEKLKDKLMISDLHIISRANNDSLLKNIERKIQHYEFSDRCKNFETDNYIDVKYVAHMISAQDKTCCICGCDLLLTHYKRRDPRQFSVDRLDSNLGHVKGNVQITCLRCNCSKKQSR
eukprot:764268-Hanusia_phi.AAC.1